MDHLVQASARRLHQLRPYMGTQMSIKTLPLIFTLSACALALTGCGLQSTGINAQSAAGLPIKGSIFGGQQPVTGARVYLMAASTSGYGNASTSLLTRGDGIDQNGEYMLTDSGGNFSLSGAYTCTPNSQVYIVGLGGKSSPTTSANSNIALMAAVGACPASGTFVGQVPFISLNEITTVAAAYALSGFLTSPTALSTPATPLAVQGIANAFLTAASLSDLTSGSARSTVGNNGTLSAAKLNTLADIIAACINTDGTSSACSTLMSNARSASGVTPSDTVTATINIAHNPGANVQALYGLINAQAPFQPTVAQPNDFALTIRYTTPNLSTPADVRADAFGNVWIRNSSGKAVVEKLGPTGTVLSGASGFIVGGTEGGHSLSLDSAGNAFLANRDAFSIIKIAADGSLLSPPAGFQGVCNNPNAHLYASALDSAGNVWGVGAGGCALKISNSGTILSGGGYPSTSGEAYAVAVDSTNAAWIADGANSSIRRVSSSGTVLADYGSSVYGPSSIAIDRNDTAFVTNRNFDSVSHLQVSGSVTALVGGGLASPNEVSVDGANQVWIANRAPRISAFMNDGTAITPATGYVAAPQGNILSLSIDGSGNVWTAVTAPDVIVEFVGAATPVARPIKPGQLGVRP